MTFYTFSPLFEDGRPSMGHTISLEVLVQLVTRKFEPLHIVDNGEIRLFVICVTIICLNLMIAMNYI